MRIKKDTGWMEVVIRDIFGIDFVSELIDKEVVMKKLACSIEKLEIVELQILSLYYCDNLTVKDICEVLSINEFELNYIMDITAVKLRKGLIDKFCLATHGYY